MVSSVSSKPQQQPPLSYADHAKKAQNIIPKSAPIHPHSHPTPQQQQQQWGPKSLAPQPSSASPSSTNTNSNTSTSNSTPYSGLSGKSGSSLPTTTTTTANSSVDVTPSSSVILTRPQTRAVSPSLSPSTGTTPGAAATEAKSPSDSKGMNGGDVSTSATSTTAGTNASASTPLTQASPQKPVNVWDLRKEQMAQAQAQAQASSSRPTVPQASSQTPAPTPAQKQTSPDTSTPSSTPMRIRPATDAAHNNKPPPPSSNYNAPPSSTIPVINGIPPVSVPTPTPNAAGTTAHNDEDDDPFVVRPRRPTSLHSPPASVPPATAAAPPPPPPPPPPPRLPLSVPPMDDADSWPEVGKALATATSCVGSAPGSVGGSDRGGRDGEGGKDGGGGGPKKNEKTKWVQIPPSELQATADALAPRSSKSRSRRHGRNNNNNRSNQASGSGSSRVQSGRNSTSHSAAPSQSVSGAPSLTHSRAGSLQSSPRLGLGGRGRRLPAEDLGQIRGSVGRKESRSGSPIPVVAVGGGDVRPPPAQEGTFYPPQIPHQEPYHHSPQPHSQLHSQPHSHPQSQSHSPKTNPYTSPGPNVYLNPDQLQNQNFSPRHHLPHHQQQQPVQPFQGVYQPQPYGPGYEYPHGHVPGPGQPYPAYWTEHERLPPTSHLAIPPQQRPFAVDPQVLHSMSPPIQPIYQQQQAHPLMFGQVTGKGSVTLPPSTMMARPPPPGESEAVAGYREVLPLPAASNPNPGARADGQNHGLGRGRAPDEKEDRGRPTKGVVFGSIGLPGADHSPSPMLKPAGQDKDVDDNEPTTEEKEGDRSFKTFSIGVHPGEPELIRRSRTRSMNSKTKGRGDGRPMVDLTNGQLESDETFAGIDSGNDGEAVGQKVIDLTDPETKWEFGTTKHLDEEVQAQDNGSMLAGPEPQLSQPDSTLSPLPSAPPPPPTAGDYPSQEQTIGIAPSFPPVMGLSPITTPPNGLHMDPIVSALLPIQNAGPSLLRSDTNGSTTAEDEGQNGDDWEVKDYGYGFGPVSGSGYAPAITKDERLARERERERHKRIEREERGREAVAGGFGPGRPRRGSYAGGGGYVPLEARGGFEHRGSFEPRGGFEQRGGFEYRGGFERGFGRRGRPFRGYNRGYGRGAYQQQQQRQQQQQQQQPHPHFTVTPPAQLQSLPQHNEPVNGYYQSASQPLATYISGAYEPFQPSAIQPAASSVQQGVPPFPTPLSALSFPLDPTRWYLLGQLEYYLSSQNLAQDFFLRQRMDSRGWIPIPLIASFNRVRTLTTDVRLVKDVLNLSTIVEVRYDWVRMGGNQWEQFVLPDASTSSVESQDAEHTLAPPHEERRIEGDADGGEVEGEVEDEDEDDVVFVMGRDVEDSWTAGRRQT